MTHISRDDWMKALGDAVKPNDPDALTILELAQMFGIGRQAAYIRVTKLVAEKKATKTYKDIPTSSGNRRVPAYKLVKAKK